MPNAMLCFSGEVKEDEESARVELSLQQVDDIVHYVGSGAQEMTIRIPKDYPAELLRKLKIYLDAAVGRTVVFLEVPSKENPEVRHRIRLGKQIFLHKSLLNYIEDTMGSDAWSIS